MNLSFREYTLYEFIIQGISHTIYEFIIQGISHTIYEFIIQGISPPLRGLQGRREFLLPPGEAGISPPSRGGGNFSVPL